MTHYRHGDISLHSIKELPKKLEQISQGGNFILAYGEVTGHTHRLLEHTQDQYTVYRDGQGRNILAINKPTPLVHEEHKEIILQPGFYIQEQEKEYDYFSLHTVKVSD